MVLDRTELKHVSKGAFSYVHPNLPSAVPPRFVGF